jgi:hypothetical protein
MTHGHVSTITRHGLLTPNDRLTHRLSPFYSRDSPESHATVRAARNNVRTAYAVGSDSWGPVRSRDHHSLGAYSPDRLPTTHFSEYDSPHAHFA